VTGGRELARHDFCLPFVDRRAVRPRRGFAAIILKRNGVESSFCSSLLLRMIFSDLAWPAAASTERRDRFHGFAQAGNRQALFGIML
jgi:hypothetical protein